MKKKDLVCLILDEYREEKHLSQVWSEAKKSAEAEGNSSQNDYVCLCERLAHEHYLQAFSLEKILISYGYSSLEVIQIELSNLPSSEFVK